VLAHQTYSEDAPESWALRWAFVCAALILAAIAVVLLLASHSGDREKRNSDRGSQSSLRSDAYRQPKPLGSAFASAQHHSESVLVTEHAPSQLPQVP